MKTIILSLFTFLSFSFANAQTWLWAKSGAAINGWQGARGYSVATDKNQNAFECGAFDNSSLSFGTYTLINDGSDDIFLAKYDASGNVIWAKSAGGTGADEAYGVAIDVTGNAFVGGCFNASFMYGTDSLTTAAEAESVFIAKYDVNGNVLWARSSGGSIFGSTALCVAITLDALGNVYLLGLYDSPTIIFGADTLVNTTTNPYTTPFIVKYSVNGNVIWAQNVLNSGAGSGSSISVDGANNIYITGYVSSSTAKIGSNTIINPAGSGQNDVFVAKYNSGGSMLWVKNAYENGSCGASGTTDSAGNTFIAGTGDSKIFAFGTDTANLDYANGFLLKIDSSGSALWAKNIYCVAGSGPTNLCMTINGGVYLTGIFYSPTIVFGTDSLTDTVKSYNHNIFLTKYDANGNALWLDGIGTTGYTEANAVAIDLSGNAYITGNFSDSIMFNSDTLISAYSAVFLAKCGAGVTGINELAASTHGAKIYPNPNSGSFTIALQNVSGKSQLEIYNVLGEIICQSSLDPTNTEVNLGNQSTGVYFYRILSEDGKLVSSGKLLIAR